MAVSPSGMYRIATALNHKGNRRRLGYKGPDTFLTSVNGELKMMAKSGDAGQLWHFTGDSCLLNGTGLYLTATHGGLQFLKRDFDNMGQKWISDWCPRSVLFSDQCLNIYGGRNGVDKMVGMYRCTKSSNEEWRHAETDDFLKPPECIDIKWHLENIKLSNDAKELSDVVHTEDINEGSQTMDGDLKWTEKQIKQTMTSHSVDVKFSTKYFSKVTTGGSVPFVASGEGEIGFELSFEAGYAFKTEEQKALEKTVEHSRTFKIPPHTRVRFTMMAKKVECRIPYTMIFNDGTVMKDHLIHKDTTDIRFHLKEEKL